MEYLRNCWLPITWSKDLKRRPLSIQLLGRRLVVFRDREGQAVVMEDRCAHRGVALSEGYLNDGCITCPYHGWSFDSSGRCSRIPSLPRDLAIPDYRVPVYAVCEQEETVWVSFTQTDTPAPSWRHRGARATLGLIELEGNYIHLLENLVDNPHAGFLHAGLIRGEPTQRVTAEITETPLHIVIRTLGEKKNESLLFILLGRRGEEVGHIEEYLAPNQMVSTYTQRGYVAGVQSFIVPVDEHRTRWFYRIFLSFGAMTSPVFPIFKKIVKRILLQDAAVVKKVEDQARIWPDRPLCSTHSDTPSLLVARAARSFAKDGPPTDSSEKRREITYML